MNEQKPPAQCDAVIRAHQLCLDLNDIITLINSSHDIDEILHKVTEESSKALRCESARIAMREGDNWVIRYIYHLPEDLIGRSFSDMELPHAALAMTTRKPVAIDDAFHDDRTNKEMMKSMGIRSVLVLPLMDKKNVIGTLLYGYSSKIVSFTEIEIDYAERMATGIGIALQDARQYLELEESKKLSDALIEIDNVLYSTQDSSVIMNKMLHLATEVIGAESAVIFSKEDERWMVRHEYNLPVSLIGQTFSNTEVMHTAITAETKRSYVEQDAVNSPLIDQKFVQMLGIRSLLDFPLVLRGEVIGDLTFHYHSSPVPFNERQIEFVRKLQIAISLALENDQLLDTYRRSETRLHDAEKLGKSGFFHYDVQTRKINWSEGMFHLFGRDEALGEPSVEEFFQLYAVEPGVEEMTRLVRDREVIEFDAKIIRDGLLTIFHCFIRSLKDVNGHNVAFLGTLQDITKLKRAEQQLRESESFKQGILDSLPAHIAVLDSQGVIIAVNQPWVSFAENNGLADAEPVSVGANYMAVCRKAADMSEPLAVEALAGIEGVLTEKFPSFTINYPCHSPTQQRWFMLKVVRPNHNMEGAVVIHLDITDRIKAENDLQYANHDLEAFNYTVAHDLRKPLTVVNGYCQAIRELCGDQLTEDCSTFLREAYEGTLRMNKLIDALIQFSGLAHTEPKREPVNLCALAGEVAAELKQAEPERRVNFQITKGITAEGDPDLLRVVLANLLGNAWKYTSNRDEAFVEFGTSEISDKRGRVYFVKDNGLGFHREEAYKLFEPFQRLEESKEVGGTGIGLATVARIIHRHHGEIWAEGEPGRGATFYFTLN